MTTTVRHCRIYKTLEGVPYFIEGVPYFIEGVPYFIDGMPQLEQIITI